MAREDVLAEQLGIHGLLLGGRPAADRVGDVEAAVEGALEGTEDTGTGGGGLETDVEAHLEGALLPLNVLGQEVLAIDLLLALVDLVEAKELEGAAGQKETGGVARSPVLETERARKTIVQQLPGVSLSEDLVTLDGGRSDLAQAVAVGSANDHAVLRSVELGLVLGDQPLASTVVSLTSAPAAVLGLIALEVRIVLHKLHESHGL
mmetsp:Transcript_23580/g.63665  ORF Transcript_23580/g.63665 Transcript_23580/m.63665 type:complete len:206 (-) Transcript_23580:84-701(-)